MAKKSNSKKTVNAAIQVDIVSDVVCPWCWLGIALFKQAVKDSQHNVVLTWRPYMLDPDVPEGGVPYGGYMKQKFGDAPSSRFKAMRAHLEEAGPELGIDFKFDDIPIRPNTLNAHRLIRWAQGQSNGGQNKGDAAALALFKAFFTDQKDIGDPKVLTDIAKQIGLDGALITELLAKDDDKDAVSEEIAFFRDLGISGVPTFIYNGQFALQGAQGASVHMDALDKAANASSSGKIIQ